MATLTIDMLTDYAKARFWSNVDVRAPNHCWPWRKSTDGHGYGYFCISGKHFKAHQAALFAAGEDRPSPKHAALHSCDNPSCVNPAHLRWGTQLENARDREERGRGNQPTGQLSYVIKLTADQARYIAQSSEKGIDLAKRFGVSTTQISAIKNRRAWSHLHAS